MTPKAICVGLLIAVAIFVSCAAPSLSERTTDHLEEFDYAEARRHLEQEFSDPKCETSDEEFAECVQRIAEMAIEAKCEYARDQSTSKPNVALAAYKEAREYQEWAKSHDVTCQLSEIDGAMLKDLSVERVAALEASMDNSMSVGRPVEALGFLREIETFDRDYCEANPARTREIRLLSAQELEGRKRWAQASVLYGEIGDSANEKRCWIEGRVFIRVLEGNVPSSLSMERRAEIDEVLLRALRPLEGDGKWVQVSAEDPSDPSQFGRVLPVALDITRAEFTDTVKSEEKVAWSWDGKARRDENDEVLGVSEIKEITYIETEGSRRVHLSARVRVGDLEAAGISLRPVEHEEEVHFVVCPNERHFVFTKSPERELNQDLSMVEDIDEYGEYLSILVDPNEILSRSPLGLFMVSKDLMDAEDGRQVDELWHASTSDLCNQLSTKVMKRLEETN